MCLCFSGSKPILKGLSHLDMTSDVDTMRFTSNYLFTSGGESYLGNPDFKSIFLAPLWKNSILLSLEDAKICFG